MITADLHDGEHDDVEGGVGAVEHLPLHAGVQGAHLLVDVLKRKNDILKDGKIVYTKHLCTLLRGGFYRIWCDKNTILFKEFSQNEENLQTAVLKCLLLVQNYFSFLFKNSKDCE